MNSSIFFNKTFRRAALASALSLAVFSTPSSFAAKEATSASAADVIKPIAIEKKADLSFGRFAPGAGGTVSISTGGARTTDGTIPSSINSTLAAGQFDVTGDNNAKYSIVIGGVAELSGPGSEDKMALTTISDLTGETDAIDDVTSGTLNGSGTQTIFLGGVLTVGASQTAGNYTGDVTATVEYN
jgi:hypothetical protein